ncbi:MAG: acyl-ACP--UDP-N-acetylglucosamine O-acyltransferase [Candidatus Omnitrophica bacterium]|nr:acyl-ACP--UDP-N-acetylglucosamine O-acyltransferase [Candidatus Omnitrophota bacterium]MCF7894086.1 acyl-ACP--UDP-N-acetylglucosamine O-acyltransferase [Candidatus Omnitrophota bacterium]
MSKPNIDKTAKVDKNACLEEGVSIGPYAIVEEKVHLAKGVSVGAHAQIKGNSYLGENSSVGTGAVIGEVPQMLGMRQTKGKLYIGKNNIIREYVTIHTATKENCSTTIGDNNFLMGFSHVAHDCKLADNIVVCNGSLLAGCVEVGKGAFISGCVVVHQFVRVGKLAMVGGLSRVNQDVAPFMMVVGDSRVWGINLVGLRRASFPRAEIKKIKQAYKILYRKGLSLKKAISELESVDSEKVKEIYLFILSSKRGISGPKKSSLWEKIFLDYPYFVRSKILTYDRFLESRKNKKCL